MQCHLFSNAQDAEDRLATYKANKLIQDFSLVIGPSINFLRGNDAVDDGPLNEQKYLVGYSIGMQISTKNLINKFSLSTGLFYERKGGKSLSDAEYFDPVDQITKIGQQERSFKYKYYTLKVKMQYAFGRTSRLKVGGGGYVSYLEEQLLEIDRSGTSGSVSIRNETKFNSKTDYGLSVEISCRILKLKPFSMDLYLINDLGLKDLRPNSTNKQSTMKTNSTILLIGITF